MPPQIPAHLAHLSPDEIIRRARAVRIARERVRRDAEAAEKKREQEEELARRRAEHEILEQYRDDPERFAEEVLGVRLWRKQRELLRAVVGNRRIAVRAGHKVSKSFTEAIIALWWVKTRPRASVIVTATKDKQIREIFWAEVTALYKAAARRGHHLGGDLHETAYTGLRYGDGRKVIGIVAKDEHGWGGFSGTDVLFIVDEASGVAEGVFKSMIANTAGGGKIIALGNPLAPTGYFFAMFSASSDGWYPVHISSEDSPNVTGAEPPLPGLATQEWIDEMRRDCGPAWKESAEYQRRVLGIFPTFDPLAVIPMAYIDEAEERWQSMPDVGVLDVGVDVAYTGDDESVIITKRNQRVSPHIVTVRKMDPVEVANQVLLLLFGRAGEKNGGIVRRAPNGDPLERPRVKVDTIGIGAGVVAILKRNPLIDVFAVNVAERATAEPKPGQSRYHRLRDQLWYAARDFLKGGGALPPKQTKLRADLLAPKSNVNAEGHIVVESKADIKKRLGRSPDLGDALCMCVYDPPAPARVEQGTLQLRRY